MATPVWINLTATGTEQSLFQKIYGVKLIRNDSAIGSGDLYISFDAPKSAGSYLKLQSQEEWGPDEDIRAATIYYSSSTGNVPFRLYSKVD